MLLEDPKPESPLRPFLIAVVTAASVAAATKLAEWAVEEVRERYGSKKPKAE